MICEVEWCAECAVVLPDGGALCTAGHAYWPQAHRSEVTEKSAWMEPGPLDSESAEE